MAKATKKATKKAGKKAGKVVTAENDAPAIIECWMWKGASLWATTAAYTAGLCRIKREMMPTTGPISGKPVRVEIREAAKGKVKHGK